MMEGPGADSEEKHEPVSDIDTAVVVVDLKALDPEWPTREAIGGIADMAGNADTHCRRGCQTSTIEFHLYQRPTLEARTIKLSNPELPALGNCGMSSQDLSIGPGGRELRTRGSLWHAALA
jgi:hypothetical protein